jgi:hypothetical protein
LSSSLRAQTRIDLLGDVLDWQRRYLNAAVNGVLAAAAIFAPKSRNGRNTRITNR